MNINLDTEADLQVSYRWGTCGARVRVCMYIVYRNVVGASEPADPRLPSCPASFLAPAPDGDYGVVH